MGTTAFPNENTSDSLHGLGPTLNILGTYTWLDHIIRMPYEGTSFTRQSDVLYPAFVHENIHHFQNAATTSGWAIQSLYREVFRNARDLSKRCGANVGLPFLKWFQQKRLDSSEASDKNTFANVVTSLRHISDLLLPITDDDISAFGRSLSPGKTIPECIRAHALTVNIDPPEFAIRGEYPVRIGLFGIWEAMARAGEELYCMAIGRDLGGLIRHTYSVSQLPYYFATWFLEQEGIPRDMSVYYVIAFAQIALFCSFEIRRGPNSVLKVVRHKHPGRVFAELLGRCAELSRIVSPPLMRRAGPADAAWTTQLNSLADAVQLRSFSESVEDLAAEMPWWDSFLHENEMTVGALFEEAIYGDSATRIQDFLQCYRSAPGLAIFLPFALERMRGFRILNKGHLVLPVDTRMMAYARSDGRIYEEDLPPDLAPLYIRQYLRIALLRMMTAFLFRSNLGCHSTTDQQFALCENSMNCQDFVPCASRSKASLHELRSVCTNAAFPKLVDMFMEFMGVTDFAAYAG